MNSALQILEPHASKHISEYAALHPEIIDLTVGVPSFGPPPIFRTFLSALQDHSSDARTPTDLYAPSRGDLGLRSEITKLYDRSYGCHADPARHVLVTNGAAGALSTAILTATDTGDEVLLADPCYMLYAPLVQLLGRRARHIATSAENGFLLDEVAIAASIGPRTRVLLVNSPANPTGAVHGRDRMASLCKLCAGHGLRLLHDEVLDSFVGDTPHCPAFALNEGRDVAMCVNSLSKRFGMTGWRLGWLIAEPGLTEQASKCHTFLNLAVGHAVQQAAAAALADPSADEEVSRHARAVRDRGQAFISSLSAVPGLDVRGTPDGGFYAFVNVERFARLRRLSTSAEGVSRAVAEHMLHDLGVAVVPGDVYGERGRGFVRMSFAGPEIQLKEAVSRLVLAPPS